LTRPQLAAFDLSPEEIASDGTLSKAEVQTETKTVETLLSLLPVKAFLASKLKVAEEAKVALPRPTLALVVESRFYRHTLSRSALAEGPCAAASPLPLSIATSVNYAREEVEVKADLSKDEDRAVSISGRLVLPKKQ
jgi:hypothetical protein